MTENTLDLILTEMEENSSLRLREKVFPFRISVTELLDRTSDIRFANMLRLRIQGASLQEIANQYDCSRERVRQIISKGLKTCGYSLEEDKYIPLFDSYYFSEEEFISCFGERPETFQYLSAVCTKKTKAPSLMAATDPTLHPYLREGARSLMYRNTLCIKGEHVKKTRTALIEYVARNYFKELSSFDIFKEKYSEILATFNLQDDPHFLLNTRSQINHLLYSDFLIWTPGNKLRYYDINGHDFSELLNVLSLDQYHDVEYSARWFFREYPEIMRKYDIHDGYELHNVLRKVCPKYNLLDISFPRNPTIEFGKANRFLQIRKILVECSPISRAGLLRELDRRFGFSSAIALYFFTSDLEKYRKNGIYDINHIEV